MIMLVMDIILYNNIILQKIYIQNCPVEEDATDILDDLAEKKVGILIGGCRPIYRKKIEDELDNYNITFFVSERYEGNGCNKNVYI